MGGGRLAVLSQPAIRQNLVVKFFCKKIGAGAGGGAAGALDKLYIDQSHEAALRKIFETRVFSEAENGRIIARFWGTFCEFSEIFSRLCIRIAEKGWKCEEY